MPASTTEPKKESLRDTMESIVFAFILAFLFRTFEAEAFVIPTGSMAPTLYGRHKEAECQKCGAHIVVGASDEYDPDAGVLRPNTRLQSALCPNCRFENKQLKEALAFNGDRILVNKFPYEIGVPHRWDVFVFKYPEEPDMNYIKRLVGLPGETIRIRQGDVFLVDDKGEAILRKDNPEKQRVLQMPVYDDNHPPTDLLAAGWPERWIGAKKSTAAGAIGGWEPTNVGWTHSAETRSFLLDKKAPDELNWIRYRHIAPRPGTWEDLAAGRPLQPRAELIADYCGYNATTITGTHLEANRADEVDLGAFWVGDLTVSFDLDLGDSGSNGEVVIELVEGPYIYRVKLTVGDSTARLYQVNLAHDANQEDLLAEAPSPVSGPGKYAISFANVDDRLCLWINDKLIDFGPSATLQRSTAIGLSMPQDTDLSPVGIGARDVVSAVVKNLRLERDVYYRGRMDQMHLIRPGLADKLDNPEEWRTYYQAHADDDFQEIPVDADGFLALGDNSPRSKDSREWGHGLQSVPRKHLVGRAFYIYWPHGVPFLNDGRGFSIYDNREATGRATPNGTPIYKKLPDYPKWTVPFYPQVDRMKRIR